MIIPNFHAAKYTSYVSIARGIMINNLSPFFRPYFKNTWPILFAFFISWLYVISRSLPVLSLKIIAFFDGSFAYFSISLTILYVSGAIKSALFIGYSPYFGD